MKRYITKGLPNSRIEIADALRGIAVMGIVIYHALENFNLFYAEKSMTLPYDDGVFEVCRFLLSGKMYGIFAMLFGVSFFIMRDNQEQKGYDFSLRFAWRMLLLFIIGIVNLSFYNGDILTSYAVLGLLMIPAGYLPNKWLWAITAILLLQPVEIYLVATASQLDTAWVWAAYDRVGEANMHGSFFDSAVVNVREGFDTNVGWAVYTGRLTQTLGLFLLGILVGRYRLLYNEGNNLKIWKWVLLISLPLAVIGSNVDIARLNVWIAPVKNFCILLTEVSAVVLLWYMVKGFSRALRHICFFGRMSLSNYLLQSIIGSLLFYGWGFGLYRYLGATWSLLVGITMIVFQILILKAWNRNHDRGPMETIWRKATWIHKA